MTAPRGVWPTLSLITIVALLASTPVAPLISIDPTVVLITVMLITALGSSLVIGSLVPGVIGASLGLATDVVGVGSLTDPSSVHLAGWVLISAVVTITFCADHGQQRRGEPAWFPYRWVVIASLVIPLALALASAVLRAHTWHSNDLRASLAASVLIILASICAALVIGTKTPPDNRPPIDGWTILNSFAGHVVFAGALVIFLLLMPILLVIPARQRRVTSLMRFGSRLVLLIAPGVTWRATGNLNAVQTARVVVANHESFLDILCACVLPIRKRHFLAKPWVFHVPLLGWVARMAGVESNAAWDANEYLADDAGSLIVFPTGSRNSGVTPLRFRPGAFVLADRQAQSVLPVVIVGTGLAAPKGAWWIRPADLSCITLPPISRLPDESIREYAERCRQTIAEARLHQLADDLRHGRQHRWLRLGSIGQTPRLRQAMASDWHDQHWHALLEAPLSNGQPWLLLGLGWSSCARVIRLLHPASPVISVEADHQRRGIALSTWFRPSTDYLLSSLPETCTVPQQSLAGLVIFMPATNDGATHVLAALQPTTWIIVADQWADDWARLLQRSAQQRSAQEPSHGMRRLVSGSFATGS